MFVLEFKLNKIDTELRYKVKEQTSEGKIHNNGSLYVNKEKNNKEREREKEESNKKPVKLLKYNDKKIIVGEENIIEVEAFLDDNKKTNEKILGRYLDSRK